MKERFKKTLYRLIARFLASFGYTLVKFPAEGELDLPEPLRRAIEDSLDEDNLGHDTQYEALTNIVRAYHGYRNAYNAAGAELGELRTTAAPVFRKEAELEGVTGKPSIFLVTLPKSATVYVSQTLAGSLGYHLSNTLVTPTFPKNIIWARMLLDFKKGGMLAVSHLQPETYNFRCLNRFGVSKGVLHIRDPRAAAFSMYHFIRKHSDADEMTGMTLESMAEKTDEEVMQRIVRFTAVSYIDWIDNWLQKLADEPKLDFHLVRHEQLVADEQSYFQSILDFYGIDGKIDPVHKDENVHFRSGDNEEWRRALLPETIQQINDSVPNYLWDKFGWRR